MTIRTVRQLAASRRPRRRRPMSGGALVAIGLVVAAVILGGVSLAMYFHASARQDALAEQTARELQRVLETLP